MRCDPKNPLAWAALLLAAVAIDAHAAPTDAQCKARVNDTQQKVVECIQAPALWRHMVEFQAIADRNPGPDGHPSRNAGEPGYRASVDYVAGLLRQAGYRVAIQTYEIPYYSVVGTPRFEQVAPVRQRFEISRDWYVAFYTGSGEATAAVEPVGPFSVPPTGPVAGGCTAADYAGFTAGHIALVQRGGCAVGTKAALAAAAGAAAVVLFNDGNGVTNLAPPDVYLSEVSKIPVFVTSYAVGAQLYAEATTGRAPVLALGVQGEYDPHRADYNLIADSPYGDPTHVIVAEGHLDAIFGAGMLDNASGSTTILELALTLARTPTRNQMRYVWFGGEEIGLLGSAHYTQTLGPDQLAHIAFDLDADVTATANVDYLIANPAYASNASSFPPNVAPESVIGNQYFEQYFAAQHVYAIDGPRAGGNNGTDSNSFSLVGVPNSGVFTGQDCCRSLAAVNLWGGYLGNREGHVPGYDGGCVDYIGRWCDNLANNDPVVLERVSKGFAYVAAELANHAFDATPATARRPAAQPAGTPVGPRLSPPHRGALSAQ